MSRFASISHQPTTSRSRLTSRSGITSSRSGDRLHIGGGGGEGTAHLTNTGSASSRNKAIRTATGHAATGSFGKAATTTAKRPALGDKTNIQQVSDLSKTGCIWPRLMLSMPLSVAVNLE